MRAAIGGAPAAFPARHQGNSPLVLPLASKGEPTANRQGRATKPWSSAQCHQGCIKLGLARAGTGGREVFPLLSDGQSNPEGWQKVAGGSFVAGGTTHRLTGGNTVASWRDARTVRIQVKPAISKHDPGQASQGSGTHSGCVITSAFTRWSAPLPWPTTGYHLPPSGLDCENAIRTQPCRTNLRSLMQPCQRHPEPSALKHAGFCVSSRLNLPPPKPRPNG
jgi:hypothetical protein